MPLRLHYRVAKCRNQNDNELRCGLSALQPGAQQCHRQRKGDPRYGECAHRQVSEAVQQQPQSQGGKYRATLGRPTQQYKRENHRRFAQGSACSHAGKGGNDQRSEGRQYPDYEGQRLSGGEAGSKRLAISLPDALTCRSIEHHQNFRVCSAVG